MGLRLKFSVLFCVLGAALLAVPLVPAQVAPDVHIHATINHPFIVGNATLPPGKYIFHMMRGTQLQIMTVTNEQNNMEDEFQVRRTQISHIPNNTELVFNQYGNKYVLANIFDKGSKIGVTVLEPSREEARLQKQGQTANKETENQTD